MDQNQGTYKKTSPANYYTIQNWMTHECGLKYPQRDIYAILYGFTQDKTQWVEPTQAYIAELVGISRETVNRNIQDLEEQGWLRKVTASVPGRGTRSRYQTVTPQERIVANSQRGVTQDHRGCDAGSQGVSPSVTGGVTQDHTDNYYNNKKINNPIHTQGNEVAATAQLTTQTHPEEKIASSDASARVVKKSLLNNEELDRLTERYVGAYPKPLEGNTTFERVRWALKQALGLGASIDDICAAAEAYGAYKRSQGVENTRFYINARDFLRNKQWETDWAAMVSEDKRLKRASETLQSPMLSPEEEAVAKAKIASKYEWMKYCTCSKCGSKMYREGDTNMYVCENRDCNAVTAIKPTRKASSE